VDNPRREKVAVVDEVKGRFADADAVLLTEYRGLDVAAMAELRRNLRAAGGEYKIYKNTLVRLAAKDAGLQIEELLVGPTALAFVHGDAVTVAKALRDFARSNPALMIKGGLLGNSLLGAGQVTALADIAPREELLARFAGGLAAPMRQLAGLLQALPRNLAYGLKALIDQGGAPGAPAAGAEPAPDAAPAVDSEASPEEAPAEAIADMAPAVHAEASAEAPAGKAVPETIDPAAPEAADDTAAPEAADSTEES